MGASVITSGRGLANYAASAFGQQTVAAPYSLADMVQRYRLPPEFYNVIIAGGGTQTYIALQSASKLAVTNANADAVHVMSHEHFRYQAGRGMRGMWTCYHEDTGQANQRREWGFWDASGANPDGLIFRLDGTTLQIVRATSTTVEASSEEVVDQADWNVDPLDGSGNSAVTLDITKGNIYEIRFQWLGVGTVEFYINGILVHRMANANTIAAPYMRTAQLHVHWRIINTAASTASSFTMICAAVWLEGGEDPPEWTYAADQQLATVGTTLIPIVSVRLNTTFQGQTTRGQLLPILLRGGGDVRGRYVLVWNPATLTGGAWNAVDADSMAQQNITATAYTGGSIITSFRFPANGSVVLPLDKIFRKNARKVLLRNGVSDVVTVACASVSGANNNFEAALTWGEIQ
jgi:hypothetical protein